MLLILSKNMVFLVIIAAIPGSLLSAVPCINPSFATSESNEGGSTSVSDEGRSDILQATITASKQENILAGQPLTTMVFNGSLVGPTLRDWPR
jgi:hypothetical protein